VSGIAANATPGPVAHDTAETQPLVDITAVPVPTDSLLPTSSPDIPSSKMRANYQMKRSKPNSPDDTRLFPVTSVLLFTHIYTTHTHILDMFVTRCYKSKFNHFFFHIYHVHAWC